MKRHLFAGLLALAASGCTASNLPVSTRFPAIVDRPAEARVFLDANGTFYPDGWRRLLDEQAVAKRKSLLNAASPAQREDIGRAEQQQLEKLAALIAGKARVFILIHGFNINEADSGLAFDIVERRIGFTPADAVIRLHWDGMLGSGTGAGAVWFAATGYSQMAGMRGLRRILQLPRGQDVYLISHSRGASVILSALGNENPPFDPGFRKGTMALPFADAAFMAPAPLSDRGNRIHAIMLGPAVGFPDFWRAKCEPDAPGSERCSDPASAPAAATPPCPQYRGFTPQLQAIRYTTNQGDDTLRKWAFNLRRYFNATDLGSNPGVGAQLANCYSFPMKAYKIKQTHPHAFVRYAQDPELAEMLQDSGVKAE